MLESKYWYMYCHQDIILVNMCGVKPKFKKLSHLLSLRRIHKVVFKYQCRDVRFLCKRSLPRREYSLLTAGSLYLEIGREGGSRPDLLIAIKAILLKIEISQKRVETINEEYI